MDKETLNAGTKAKDINYPSQLFPKSFHRSMYDDMVENGEITPIKE